MKLNIGSGPDLFDEDYINIDNLCHWNDPDRFYKELKEYNEEKNYKGIFIVGDGVHLPFKDCSFNEIYSQQCVGTYVKNLIDILRVLKTKGKLKLQMRADDFVETCSKLICYGCSIKEVRIDNGHWNEVMSNSQDAFNLTLVGVKEKEIDYDMKVYIPEYTCTYKREEICHLTS